MNIKGIGNYGTIFINGTKYQGKNISIINGKVCIDGEFQKKVKGVVRIEIGGNLTSLRTDADVNIKGNVFGSVSAGGSVECGDIGGNVDAGGSVRCGDVVGNVDAGGSVECGDVIGDVDAGGSIRRR